jgi:hypothetical protein
MQGGSTYAFFKRIKMNIVTQHQHYLTQSAEAEGFAKQIIEAGYDNQVSFTNEDDYLKSNLLFITVTFSPRSVAIKHPTRSSPIGTFGLLYRNLMHEVLGGNIARKRRHQPLTIAFADFEGSRQIKNDDTGRFVVPDLRGSKLIDPRTATFPHIHSLMLTAPDSRARICDELSNIISPTRVLTPSVDTVQVEHFDPTKGSLQNLISYCSKGVWQTRPSDRDDLWQVFPPNRTRPWKLRNSTKITDVKYAATTPDAARHSP